MAEDSEPPLDQQPDARLTSQGAISDEALRKAEEFVEQEEGAANRLTGTAGNVVTGIAVAMTLFHLYAAYDIVPTQPLRYTHVAFVWCWLPAVSDRGAVSQPHPLVGRGGGGGSRSRSWSTRSGAATISPTAPPCRTGSTSCSASSSSCCCSRRRGAPPAGSCRSSRCCSSPTRCSGRICRRRGRIAATTSAAPRRPSLHHARRHLRRRGRCLVDADHHVHDLRRVPAAFRRRKVLHRFLDGADGRQAEQRRPHRGAVVVPARRPVGLGRRHHGDDRRGRLSDDGARRLREERRRRPARGRRARRDPLAAGARRRRVPDRRVSQDQLSRRDLDGDHPDLALLPVAAVHGRARRQAVRRQRVSPTTSR